MNILNVPVGYLPLLSHPDWTVRRRSGFLTPRVSLSSDMGLVTHIPYYAALDQTSDATFNAKNFQRKGFGLATIYRKLWDKAELNASVVTAKLETFKETREFVGAIDANYASRIGNGWNVTAGLRRATQDTFMRRYNYLSNDTSLKSYVTVSRITDNRYYNIEVSDRQSLNSGNKRFYETTVLPAIFYEKSGQGWRKNQQFRREFSAIQLDNDQSHDMARWSGVLEVTEDFYLPIGVANYEANITGDYYSVSSKPTDAQAELGDHAFLTPALSVGWRLPMVMVVGTRKAVIEPTVRIAHIGGENRTSKIANRDSSDYRIDEANLFLLNRYQGKDFVIAGSRLDGGLSATTSDSILGEVSGFLGVSKTLSGDISPGTSLDPKNRLSDYISTVSISPSNSTSFSWSGRISSSDHSPLESKMSLTTNLGSGTVTLAHNKLDKRYFNGSFDAEEIVTSYSNALKGIGSFSVGQVWDLTQGKTNPTLSSASLSSGDWTFGLSQSWGELNNKLVGKKMATSLSWNGGPQDCLYFSMNYEKDPTIDRDIKGEEKISFLLTLKHLGSFGTSTLDNLLNNSS